MEFLNEQKIIYYKQYLFRKGFSTAHDIINLIDDIENAIDNKQFLCGVFIDMQREFDTTDHNILLEKIRRMVSEEQLINRLNRAQKHFVSVNSTETKLGL